MNYNILAGIPGVAQVMMHLIIVYIYSSSIVVYTVLYILRVVNVFQCKFLPLVNVYVQQYFITTVSENSNFEPLLMK